jgi:hypothetical protein
VKCDAVDAAGNHAIQTSFVVHVVDTTAPVIAPHGNETIAATSALGAIANYAAPATSDAVDGAGTATCIPASGTQFALGDTTVKCDAVDAAGNHAVQTSFVVHVVDPAAPVIAAHPDENAEATSALGAIVNYVAPTTSDAVDGPGTATCVPASGTQFALGNTTVKCDAIDAAGNRAVQTSFVVHVVDTTAPVIAPHGDETIAATSALGAIANYAAPVTSDAVDGAGTATCVPASGTQFALGDTTVKCDAVDAAGNHAVQTAFVLHVVELDTTPPTITFVSRLPAANGFGWNNSDVTVTWSCSDNVGVVSSTVTQVITSEGSALSATGTCTDTSGITASDTQTGFNIDKTAPSLSPAISPNPVILNDSATISANASDGLSGLDVVNCGALDTSSVGSKSVTCTAADKAGNSNSVSVNYSVQYAAAGGNCKGIAGHQILQPINADGSSVFKAGSTVPAKFRVCGADGDPIGTDGVVANFRLIQIISSDIVTNVDEAVLSTTPDDVFRSGNSQWIFNISTKNLSADNTYVYLITLNDGSTIQFQFTLK